MTPNNARETKNSCPKIHNYELWTRTRKELVNLFEIKKVREKAYKERKSGKGLQILYRQGDGQDRDRGHCILNFGFFQIKSFCTPVCT